MLRIKKQYDELQAALRLREDLARMIVHDARMPLTAILGFSELLQLNEAMPLADLEMVSKIHSNARHLDSFLGDILVVAKMEEAGQLILKRSMVSINGLVQRVEDDQKLVAELKQTKIVLDLPSETRLILVDANLFQRVLENLLSNAVKFSPMKSTVKIKVENLEKDGTTGPLNPNIRVQFMDEGPGIDQVHRSRIFEKYEVVDLGRQDTQQLGLGLVFCKMVVEAHGGRIFVEDNKLKGSIFTVEI
jgi:signal transduction histidine kinase